MPTLKVACWNIEWMDKLWPNVVESKFHVDRQTHVVQEIIVIDADILCVGEGPGGPGDMQSYVDTHLPDYKLITRENDEDWGLKGQQWFERALAASPIRNVLDVPSRIAPIPVRLLTSKTPIDRVTLNR